MVERVPGDLRIPGPTGNVQRLHQVRARTIKRTPPTTPLKHRGRKYPPAQRKSLLTLQPDLWKHLHRLRTGECGLLLDLCWKWRQWILHRGHGVWNCVDPTQDEEKHHCCSKQISPRRTGGFTRPNQKVLYRNARCWRIS